MVEMKGREYKIEEKEKKKESQGGGPGCQTCNKVWRAIFKNQSPWIKSEDIFL